MARRRMAGDVIELDYNGRELTFREDLDEWSCQALKLKSKRLSALKRQIDKLDGEARRVSVAAYRVDHWGASEPVQIVMLAKANDWESLRYDEKPEKLAGLHNRRVPTVWVMIPNGNHAPERRKLRLDECFFQTESNVAAMKEAERIATEIKRLEGERKSIIAAIPRLTVEDLAPHNVKEEALDDE